MKTQSDYMTLGEAYMMRLNYSGSVIYVMLSIAGAKRRDNFCELSALVATIQAYLQGLGSFSILIPYLTIIWVAQLR